jgi:hypothetical protein
LGIAQANPGPDRRIVLHFPKKGLSRARSCNSKDDGYYSGGIFGPYRYSVLGPSRPLTRQITNPGLTGDVDSPGRARENQLHGGNLTAMDPQAGRYWPLSMGMGGLRCEGGLDERPDVI